MAGVLGAPAAVRVVPAATKATGIGVLPRCPGPRVGGVADPPDGPASGVAARQRACGGPGEHAGDGGSTKGPRTGGRRRAPGLRRRPGRVRAAAGRGSGVPQLRVQAGEPGLHDGRGVPLRSARRPGGRLAAGSGPSRRVSGCRRPPAARLGSLPPRRGKRPGARPVGRGARPAARPARAWSRRQVGRLGCWLSVAPTGGGRGSVGTPRRRRRLRSRRQPQFSKGDGPVRLRAGGCAPVGVCMPGGADRPAGRAHWCNPVRTERPRSAVTACPGR